jgi:hypothetical protein
VTYYYHLHETDDERDGPSDPGVARVMPSGMIHSRLVLAAGKFQEDFPI